MTQEKTNNQITGFDKEIPFKTPDGYFDTLSDNIMDKIENEITIKPATKMIRLLKPLLAMAASFTIIFMLIYFPLKTFGPQFGLNQKIELETEYIDIYHFNDFEIAEALEIESEPVYNDEVMEMILLASVSEIELYNFEN